MYRLSAEQCLPLIDLEANTDYQTGILIRVEPPISFDPEAVKSYLTTGDLSPFDPDNEIQELFGVTLIGSTAESTTIYAESGFDTDTAQENFEQFSKLLLERTAMLIEIMDGTANVVK